MGDSMPMQAQKLKRRIEAGAYCPDPSQVAAAVLRRTAIREFLLPGTGPPPLPRSRLGASPGNR